MLLREVTIGRSKDSDIYLDDRCIYASNNHGVIYYDGTQLMYKDMSSNGTMINNIMVKHRAVPIQRGDIIMVACRYQLNWSQIDTFFPIEHRSLRESQRWGGESPVQQALRAAAESKPDLKKWNWGAFGLYGLWGFFNGCWWAFLVAIFFGWSIIPNIIFGVYGTRLAWAYGSWTSVDDFESTQDSWRIWGIIVTCLWASAIILWLFTLGMLLY